LSSIIYWLKENPDTFIRAPRGKAAASKNSALQDGTDEPMQITSELRERVINMEKILAAGDEEKKGLVTRIVDLELQVVSLKAKVAKHR
jgi:hypothetical protein